MQVRVIMSRTEEACRREAVRPGTLGSRAVLTAIEPAQTGVREGRQAVPNLRASRPPA